MLNSKNIYQYIFSIAFRCSICSNGRQQYFQRLYSRCRELEHRRGIFASASFFSSVRLVLDYMRWNRKTPYIFDIKLRWYFQTSNTLQGVEKWYTESLLFFRVLFAIASVRVGLYALKYIFPCVFDIKMSWCWCSPPPKHSRVRIAK